MTAADQLTQAPDSQPAADPASDDRSQTFAFEHKVFSMAGGYFAYVKNTKDAAFHIPLGDLQGAIALPILRTEFDLSPETSDGKLLGIVEKSLRFVREIRPEQLDPPRIAGRHGILDGGGKAPDHRAQPADRPARLLADRRRHPDGGSDPA